jgi:ABC-2 type transport system ATP-binding protein
MSTIVEINGLSKKYGQLTALDNLHLNIEEGAVFGFLGPNGAGKTTTMRILTTLLKPTAGDAHIAGYSVRKNPNDVRRVIGYMPDFFGVYDDMKVWEYLDFFAACYNVPANVRQGMIGDLLALVDLGHKRDAYVESLSRGMKQRLCLARTLAHDPQILILDEPASGLDPRARIEMRELLRELKQMGKTIFFSSHILSEVADICTSIGIMEAGRSMSLS